MQPLTLIPWNMNFMPILADLIVERGSFSDCIVLFPHNRPRRYLKKILAAHPDIEKPVFMPEMTSIADFVSALHKRLSPTPPVQANQLDLVVLLHDIVTDLEDRKGTLLARLPKLDLEAFLPWGTELAGLLDDLLRQDITPQDLSYMEGEVAPYAAGLLEQLATIHEEYIARMTTRGWSTSGLAARCIMDNMAEVQKLLSDKHILAAGFYALSGAEDALFKTLWQDGILSPILHGDPALADNTDSHWSSAEHRAWLERWRTRVVIPTGLSVTDKKPVIRFCEGYDRHSQLARLNQDMINADDLTNSAVVLPDEGALLPVLHHLPDKEPNISMGYPLGRTSLSRLVETLLSLQENRHRNGLYHWRDIVNLIRHPYLRLLGSEDKPLRKLFQVWEGDIRSGDAPYLDPMDWEPPYGEEVLDGVDAAKADPLFRTVLKKCLGGFEHTATLAQLADGLAGLAELLHANGEKLWHNYLIDAECLFRLTTSVVPQLRGAKASHEEFSQSTQYGFLRRLLSQERVSFEPDPIQGLQVLGVLETRLLHFRTLFIPDAVEERLPGTKPYDPLLPDLLRKLLGLPNARERDNVSGYNFYRLLMGADEAIIYYQTGTPPGLLDDKAVRSRFVEQLIWEREQKTGRLLDNDKTLIETVTFPASPVPSQPDAIPVTDAIRAALHEKLTDKGLSPSSLDRYLNCPKQFFYTYLSGVRPVDTVGDDTERSDFGSLVHEVLAQYLKPHIGVKTELAKLDPTALCALFRETFSNSPLHARLPLDGRMGLTEAGCYRLTEYLTSQKTATLLGLEADLDTAIKVDGTTIPLIGRIDRIEERSDGIYILDYKTGNAPLPRQKFWDDMELRDRMESYAQDEVDPTLLTDLAHALQSVQMIAYLFLYKGSERKSPINGGLINLGEKGKEQLMFGKKWTDEEYTEAVDDITPIVIETIARHLVRATRFEANPGQRCEWCNFATACGR